MSFRQDLIANQVAQLTAPVVAELIACPPSTRNKSAMPIGTVIERVLAWGTSETVEKLTKLMVDATEPKHANGKDWPAGWSAPVWGWVEQLEARIIELSPAGNVHQLEQAA